jgi:hypothetical protein
MTETKLDLMSALSAAHRVLDDNTIQAKRRYFIMLGAYINHHFKNESLDPERTYIWWLDDNTFEEYRQ